ncbi:MAG: hypothetical protein ACFFCI_23575 [Promethearchaeota archaeon]
MLKRIKETKYYLVKIEFEKPEGVLYRSIEATKYREFCKSYTKDALLKGMKISNIKVEKKYQSYKE